MVRDRVMELVRAALARGAAEGRWPDAPVAFSVDAPRDPRHGDFALNAAMVLAKAAGQPPRQLAAAIVELLRAVDVGGDLTSLEIAGPGFINLRLAPDLWLRALERAVAEGPAYGRTAVGQGKKVIVEYVSANPTGPMHVGHGRNAVTGDGVQSLLRWAGFDVTREYYVNDYGAQVQTLARSVHLRYQEALGRQVVFPPKAYPGEYVKEIAAGLAAEQGDRWLDAPEAAWLDLFRDRAVEHVLGMIRGDLAAVDITFDRWSSEKALYQSGTVDRFVKDLEARDLVYVGKLPPPKSKKGAPPPPPQPEEDGVTVEDDLTLFRSSAYGDEVDRPVKKADGTPTYFCADIAYHWEKRQRAELLIDVLGADHGGYVPRLHAALQALGYARTDLHVVLIQMVNLTRGGEAVKMGKRAGNVVWLREVLDEVGRDATRFGFFTRRSDAPLDFDLDLMKQQTMDNPVYYVQYGHARLHAIFRKAAESSVALPAFDLGDARALDSPEEQDLIRRIAAFPDLLAGAALAFEPHRVAFYLQETIAAFHSWYTHGARTGEKVVGSDPVRTRARLFLCRALAQVLANGLAVLGVSAPERMDSQETGDITADA
ncbi:MAG: arginine--tRNA ligase [Anaeromyxobacter sp.]|nr:arginine--tRNA ligase [Anaeromyxobacter sp.]MBL0277776.1 arginine--tRNA ligase [Anaeromyxobacter sp.]